MKKRDKCKEGYKKMDKTINMAFKNCMIDGMQLIEDDGKNEPLYHDIVGIFQQLNGESGLTITIKKTEKSGEIHAS